MRSLSLSILLCSALLSASQSAYADGADDLFQQGREAAKANRLDEAEAKFEAAFSLRKGPDIASNLAQVEMALGKKREAAGHLAYAVRIMPATTKPEVKAAMEGSLADLRKQLGEITIETNLPGATITAGEEILGTTPLTESLFIDPGTAIVVQATLAAHKPAEQRIVGEAGKPVTVSLVLVPDKANAEPVTKPNRPGKSVALLVTGSVTAVALAAVGIGTGVASLNAASDRDELRDSLRATNPCGAGTTYVTECAEIEDLDGDASTFGAVAVTTASIGGAIALATLLYGVIPEGDEPASKSSETIGAAPLLGPSTWGVTFFGTF